MIRTRLTWLGILLSLALASRDVPAFGKMIHLDGSANFELIRCEPTALLCTRSVSGEGVHVLFALDPKTGAELWRCQSTNRTWTATVDGGVIYHETGGVLFKRNLTNGVILWQTELDSLPPQRASLPFSFTRLWKQTLAWTLPDALLPSTIGRSSTTTPTRYGYQAPILSGGKLLLARSASAGGGCVILRCFEDWFLLDPANGRMLQGGAGEFRGLVGAAAIFQIRDPYGTNTVNFAIQQGERQNVRSLATTDGSSIDPSALASGYVPYDRSHGLRRLFMDGSGDGSIYVVNDTPGKILRIATPEVCSRVDGNWRFLPDHLLQYTTRNSYFVPDNESNLVTVPCIELFDLRGRRLRTLDVPPPSGAAAWGIEWVGRIGEGAVAFARWRATDIGNARQVNGDELLVVDVPGLKLRHNTALGERPVVDGSERSRRTFHTAPASPYVFIMTGDVALHSMRSNSAPHELQLDALDPATGKIAWRHRESVTVRKYRVMDSEE